MVCGCAVDPQGVLPKVSEPGEYATEPLDPWPLSARGAGSGAHRTSVAPTETVAVAVCGVTSIPGEKLALRMGVSPPMSTIGSVGTAKSGLLDTSVAVAGALPRFTSW